MDRRSMIIWTVIILFLILIFYWLFEKFTQIQMKQGKEPVLIREMRNAKIPDHISGARIKTPEDGFSYTYNVWLNVNDLSYKRNDWKHVFHKGNLNGSDCQPGVWIHPGKNNLEIRTLTYSTPTKFKRMEKLPNNIINIHNLPNVTLVTNDKGLKYYEILEKNSRATSVLMFFYKSDLKHKSSDLQNRAPVQYMIIKGDIEDNETSVVISMHN